MPNPTANTGPDFGGVAAHPASARPQGAGASGGAAGPFVTGVLHDVTGSYTVAFAIGIAVSGLSALAIWFASPGKVRAVAGRLH